MPCFHFALLAWPRFHFSAPKATKRGGGGVPPSTAWSPRMRAAAVDWVWIKSFLLPIIIGAKPLIASHHRHRAAPHLYTSASVQWPTPPQKKTCLRTYYPLSLCLYVYLHPLLIMLDNNIMYSIEKSKIGADIWAQLLQPRNDIKAIL